MIVTKLPRITGKELAKVAEKLGFLYNHTTGSHMVYTHPDGRKTVIPHHSGEEIGPGLLTKIMKRELQITRDQLIKYL